LLDLFRAFRQQLGVTLVKLDVALSCRASLKADSLADDEWYGLGFGFAPPRSWEDALAEYIFTTRGAQSASLTT